MYKFFIKRKAWLRSIAITLLLTITFQLFLPAAAWALTAGPTAPEFSSFEPIDTTDMVNLQTGDFTYNVPLLEVPGPEGGYPLALSYHAGINPDQEASWVGLGWTLNPGAISRTTNFYPDDVAGAQRTVHDYWNGGDRTTYSFGVGICGVGIDVAVANDTYKGESVGVGANASYYYSFGTVSIGGGVGISPDPYNESSNNFYMSTGVSLSGKSTSSANGLGLGVGVFTNFESVGVYAGASVKNGKQHNSLLGTSINSENGGIKANTSVMGTRVNQVNGNAGKVSVSANAFATTIPIMYVTIDLGYSYMRYWSDEKDNVNTIGSLHADLSSGPFSLSEYSFDSYCLVDQSNPKNVLGEPEHQVGGSFPAFDSYAVMGQGIGGYMQPYLFEQGSLYRQNVTANGNVKAITYKRPSSFTKKAQFRFKNDFSNTTERTNTITGGFNSKNQLAGSKHIEWLTNAQIQSGVASSVYGFIRSDVIETSKWGYNVSEQVGGYMITNSSGITYHYALPVYAYNEYQKYMANDGSGYREYENKQPYAYTWLLTAITGPDYVDMGNQGLDDSDYGYWVKFSYGKWSDDFRWRTPFKGTKNDIDKNVSYYSTGLKEVYYLDAIETRSHTALFVKDDRNDGFGISDISNGGSDPVLSNLLPENGCNGVYSNSSGDAKYINGFPASSLKLSRIMLFKKSSDFSLNIDAIKQEAGISAYEFNYHSTGNCFPVAGPNSYPLSFDRSVVLPQFGKSVIKEDDISVLPHLEKNVLREIDFATDYSLCPETANSYTDLSKLYKKLPTGLTHTGKLTLKSVTYKGKGGVTNIPPMTFGYGEENPSYNADNVDMWGYYKSDMKKQLLAANENAAKMVSDESAQHVHAWSLKEIITSVGAKIKIAYESDEYNNVELAKQCLFSIKKVEHVSGSKVRVYINNDNNEDISNYYQVGNTFGMSIVSSYPNYDPAYVILNDYGSIDDCIFGVSITPWYRLAAKTITGIPISQVNTTESYIEIDNAVTYQAIINNVIESEMSLQGGCQDGRSSLHKVKLSISKWPDLIASGVVYSPFKAMKGGGLRVKSISLENNVLNKTETRYKYENGSTSYEPFGIFKSVKSIEPRDNGGDINNTDEDFYKEALKLLDEQIVKLYNNILFNAREVPGPGIFYDKVFVTEYVTTQGGEKKVPGKREYNFSNFDVDDYSRTMYDYLQKDLEIAGSEAVHTWRNEAEYIPIPGTLINSQHKEISIKDYTLRSGLLKSIIDYDEADKKLSETCYSYLHDIESDNVAVDSKLALQFLNQGLIHQSFREKKTVQDIGADMESISHRYEYPVVLLKTTNVNYTTGIKTETENLSFDFFSGQVTKSLTKDSYGNSFLSVVTPAYRQYPGMGLKVDNQNNKHMLQQETQKEVFKVNPNGDKLGLVSASVTNWANDIPVLGFNNPPILVWRKKQAFSWLGSDVALNKDGTYSVADYNAHLFDFGSQQQDNRWLKTSEITLVDAYSHVLEEKNINSRYASVKMDNKNSQVIISAANSNYNELFFSGAETVGTAAKEGGVQIKDGALSKAYSHTGNYSILVSPAKMGFSAVLDKTKANFTKKYIATVWVYLPNSDAITSVGINSSGDKEKAISVGSVLKKAGNWYLIQRIIEPTINSTSITINCENNSGYPVYFDDFRLQPIAASSAAYVYDAFSGELNYILDNDGLYTRFVYNTDGKLAKIYKEKFLVQGEVLVSESKLHYKK